METKALKKAMMTSISEILETMFFMPLEFSENEDLTTIGDSSEEPLLAVALKFEGPISGQFMAVIPNSLAKTLSANLLGLESDQVERAHVEATLREMINMTAGKTFSLYDSQSVFKLDIPEMIDAQMVLGDASSQPTAEIVVVVDTEEASLGFKLIKVD
ncbi:MAG: hypothetical protein DRG76_05815 [Deltaproteobacteria bacterium]|nr:MAG: hypothetical protein DRG76_05815 [Deltaproteobacteria bacterium]